MKLINGQLYFLGDKGWWEAIGVVLELDKTLKMKFSFEGQPYEVIGKQESTYQYSGIVYKNREEVGGVYFWIYENKNVGFIINGDWKEDNIPYDLFGKFFWKNKA